MTTTDGHTFACFAPEIDAHASTWPKKGGGVGYFDNSELVHRLQRVLRLRPSQACILFGNKFACTVRLNSFRDARVEFTVQTCEPIVPLEPIINLWVPLLERPALEDSCYAATVLGIQTISLITTAKSKRTSMTTNDRERLRRIMIAAAEQSQQFCLPQLVELPHWQQNLPTSPCIAGSCDGRPLDEYVAHHLPPTRPCTLIIGPEGDFTGEEKRHLQASASVTLCNWGPAVLRSQDAVMVGLGVLRCLLK